MRNVLKRALTVSTVFSTILWSVGVSALVPSMALAQTSCPAFSAGQMIKVTGRPAIYAVDAAGKVLYFPSGDEFKSWNTGETYGGYVSVSQSCFDSLPVPTSAPLGVNFRPGSYVVKRPSSDQLYVVQPNNTLATITADAARALYGANYKVMTVADVFWPNYGNTRGAAITEAKAHPGMLVSNGGKTYLVEANSTLREVTATGFTANRFKQAFVRPIASTAGFTIGSQITAAEAGAADRTQTGANPSTTPVSGGAVTVSLAADNPAGTILASGTAFNPVLKINLTAGSQAASVTGLTLRKTGLAANSVITGVEVVDAQGVRHGNIATSLTTDNDVTVLFASQPISIAAGSTQTVTVRVNLLAGNQTGTFAFSVVGANSVQGATAGGSFPVTGNTFQVQAGTAAVGGATVAVQPVNASGLSVNLDASNAQEVTKFRIDASASQENLRLSKFTVYNNSTAADSDVQDVQLVAQDGTVLATAQQVNKTVVFNLVSSYQIDKGTFKDFTIRAKIISGIDRSIQYVIYNNYDVVLTGTNTGAGIIATASGADTTFPVGNQTADYNKVTVTSGTLSFNKDVTSPTGAVTPGTSGVVLGKWFVKPTGEDVELRSVKVAVATNTAISSVLTGSYTIKVNGVSVYNAAPSELTAQPTTFVADISDVVLPAGQNSYITIESSVPSLASNGTAVTAYLQLGDIRKVITNQISDAGTALIAGNQISVQAAALRVTNLATPVAQSIVAGTTGVTLANIELSAASSGEDIRVSRIVIKDTVATGTITDVGNLAMYQGTTLLATTASTAINATNTTFNFVNQITVPKNGSVTLTLKGDVLTGTQGTHTFAVATSTDVTATGVTTGNTITPGTIIGAGQGMTIASSGTLTATLLTGANGAPSAAQTLVAGVTNASVFGLKLTAQKEAIKVTTITVTASGTLNVVNDIINVKLFTDSGTQISGAVAQGTLTGTSSLAFSWSDTSGLLTVNPGSPVNLVVKADIGGNGAARLGDNFVFRIASSTTDIVAKGAASGLTAAVSGAPAATAYTYISPFGVSVAADSSFVGGTVAVSANNTRLGTFKVTNNGSAPITINKFNVTNGGGTTNALTYVLKYSSEGSADYGANTVATSTGLSFTPNVTISQGNFRYFTVQVSAGTLATGDNWQLSVASLGDVTYTVNENDLGYDIDSDGDVQVLDVTGAIPTEGKPILPGLTRS